MRKTVRLLALLGVVLPVASACGVGGMARAVTATGQGFERAECLADQFRTGDTCDQSVYRAR